MYSRFFVFILFLQFSVQSFCTNELSPIIVSPNDGSVEITNRVHYFVDDTRHLTLEQVLLLNNWKTSEKNSLNFSYNTNPHWLKFSVIASSNTSFLKQLLVINYPVLDSIDIYFRS